MTFEEFDKRVRQQIQARKPAKLPDEHTIQTAETFYEEDRGAIRADTAPECAALAIRLALAYPQEPSDTGQHTVTPQGQWEVFTAQARVDELVILGREDYLGTSAVPFQSCEAAQSGWAGLSAGDLLMSFCRDVASATKTTALDVGMAVLAGKPLALSAGNYGTVPYSVARARESGGTEMLQFPTLELLTGNIPSHLWSDVWLFSARRVAGHTPHAPILTEENQERVDTVRAFIAEQKQVWEWVQGDAPKRFWPSTWLAWDMQCKQQRKETWRYPSHEAMRKAYKRLPDEQE